MACDGGTGNPLLDVAKGFFEFLGDPIGTIVKNIANVIMAGAVEAFRVATAEIPTFSAAASGPVNSQVKWLVTYVAVGSLLFACIRMASERRGEAGQTALRGMVRLIVVAGGGTAIVGGAAAVGDDYANYLFKGAVDDQISEIGCGPSSGIEPFLLLILAFLLLIAAIVHTILLYVRLGVMIVLFGTLPLAAAASMSDWGGGWWRKHLGWMIAWLLYKPTAGLVIYAGSDLITGGGGGASDKIHTKIAGICVMLLSAISLPALMKLIVPATAGLGGAGAQSSAVSAAGGGIASGAKSIVSPSSAGGGGVQGKSGGSGASGPAGASSTGSAGHGGRSGGVGRAGPAGLSGGGGGGPGGARPGGSAGGGGGGGVGAAGGSNGSRALAGAGPIGVALAAASVGKDLAKGTGKLVAGGVDGANGEAGHNK